MVAALTLEVKMGVYGRYVVPRLVALAMRNHALIPFRRRIGGSAIGRVLELGIGPGLNLAFYGPQVTSVVGIDPSSALLRIANDHAPGARLRVEPLEGTAECLPLDDHSVDTAVTTWTLCSVGDPATALREVRRVLKPGGTLLFVEHGLAPDANTRWWQDRLTPVWKHIAGGCHLNRRPDDLIQTAGFAWTASRPATCLAPSR